MAIGEVLGNYYSLLSEVQHNIRGHETSPVKSSLHPVPRSLLPNDFPAQAPGGLPFFCGLPCPLDLLFCPLVVLFISPPPSSPNGFDLLWFAPLVSNGLPPDSFSADSCAASGLVLDPSNAASVWAVSLSEPLFVPSVDLGFNDSRSWSSL